jgi:dipeptidyl aminopeptidase/acylaminoacyl peptidase
MTTHQRIIAPNGSWKSPISSRLIASANVGLMDPALDGDDVYWLESRPTEAGRNVIVQRSPDGTLRDVNPAPINVRSLVHEMGGGAFTAHHGHVVYSNYADQQLYLDGRQLTHETGMRYADLFWDTAGEQLVCIREDHTVHGEAKNTLVTIPLSGGPGRVIVEGADFYTSPRVSPDGRRLAWLEWRHPNMPWDGTELWVGTLSPDSGIEAAQRVAGGPAESIFEPRWDADGSLYFVSDRSDWWNLYRWKDGDVTALCPLDAEFGEPQWGCGMSTYEVVAPGRLVCAYNRKNLWRLALLDVASGKLKDFDLPFTDIHAVRATATHAVFIGATPLEPAAIVRLDLNTGSHEILRRSNDARLDTAYLSRLEAIEFPTSGNRTAHAFYFAPTNADFAAPDGELPPLVVMSHGGPTGCTPARLKLNVQFWASRGFAVVDVNYGGSTGYGRAYRERLRLQWGIVDVDDCVAAAQYLVETRRADPQRVVITGGSAGGYTTLCALTFRDVFKAGASHYGVSDCEALTRDTHKFESRYGDSLFGPWPEAAATYRERSPIHHIDRLSCPLILTQGLEDKIVPPNQSEMMYVALRDKGIPVAYVPFEGEQHGYRKAENIQRALDAELYFYSRVFGFALAEPIEPVSIANLQVR